MRDELRPLRLPPAPFSPDAWRERGVTHWHLVRSEWDVNDRATRWDGGRAAAERRQRPTHGIARGPDEAADWFVGQRRLIIAGATDPAAVARQSGLVSDEDWASCRWWRWRAACKGEDVLGLQAMGHSRIAHLSAYAMTASECRCDKNRAE